MALLLGFASCSKKENIVVNIVSYNEDGSEIEYVKLEGMSDLSAQQRINEELQMFATWPLVNAEETPIVTAKAKYAVIGGKYISARSEVVTKYAETPYPVNELQSVVFDLETADFANQPDLFVASKAALLHAFSSGKFLQVWPDTPLDGIVDILIEELSLTPGHGYEFYLTEKTLGIHLGQRQHAVGDYWAFEAPYGSIKDVLTPEFKELLKL